MPVIAWAIFETQQARPAPVYIIFTTSLLILSTI
jgi:hypothetical protein